MADLFGLDIAGIIAEGIEGAGNLRSGTLSTTVPGTRTGGSLTGGTNPTSTSHTFQGMVEEKAMRRKGAMTAEVMSIVTILGATVSPIKVPAINDQVVIDSVTYMLLELMERDPAGAVYQFRVEAS